MEKWLLVQWADDSRTVVSRRSVLNKQKVIFRTGASVLINDNGVRKLATYLARSDDRSLLQRLVTTRFLRSPFLPSMLSPLEDTDYSASETSWVPTDEEDSDSEVENVRPKEKIIIARPWRGSILESDQVPQQSNRPNQANRAHQENRPNIPTQASRSQSRNSNCAPDSNTTNAPSDPGKVDVGVIEGIFKSIFQLYNDVSNDFEDNVTSSGPANARVYDVVTGSDGEDVIVAPPPPNREEPRDASFADDGSERSADNVLISNKYENIQNQNLNASPQRDEWIPIGTGATVIHRDKYKKVKWTSYTTATRTLLLALFSRRTLAMCSLTGKKSPAFQDKPAKNCLDPKKISDIICEVMGRFRVKENTVRSIITTKCADESKMLRARIKKKKKDRSSAMD
ncbi:hypothetical protein ACJJTC_000533 [Scirpophaga incertulas]